MEPDYTLNLPVELLYRIFDIYGDTIEEILLTPGHVCSRWRAVALRHPLIYRDVWLCPRKREITEGDLGLFITQIWAGAQDGLDIELNIETGADLGFLELVFQQWGLMERCVTLNLEYWGTPSRQRSFFDVLCRWRAPRLRVLKLRLAVPDSIEELDNHDDEGDEFTIEDGDDTPFVIPAGLFAGHAPALHTLEYACQDRWITLQHQPIPAFQNVTTLHLEPRGADLDALLTNLPGLRHFHAACFGGCSTLPAPSADVVAGGHLDSFQLCIFPTYVEMTAAWLSALDISRLRRVVMEVSTPAEIISPYFRSMRGPIELSLQVLRFPQKLSVYRKHGLVFLAAAPQVDKSFQAPWGQLKMEPHALAEYCALMPRVTRLEFPTAAWADMARLAAPSAMLALTTLILDVRRGRLPGDYVPFVHGPSAVVRQIACPNLEQLVLVGHRKVRLRTAAIAHFMRARLGIAERARPTILLKTSGISLRGPALRLRRLVRKIIAT